MEQRRPSSRGLHDEVGRADRPEPYPGRRRWTATACGRSARRAAAGPDGGVDLSLRLRKPGMLDLTSAFLPALLWLLPRYGQTSVRGLPPRGAGLALLAGGDGRLPDRAGDAHRRRRHAGVRETAVCISRRARRCASRSRTAAWASTPGGPVRRGAAGGMRRARPCWAAAWNRRRQPGGRAAGRDGGRVQRGAAMALRRSWWLTISRVVQQGLYYAAHGPSRTWWPGEAADSGEALRLVGRLRDVLVAEPDDAGAGDLEAARGRPGLSPGAPQSSSVHARRRGLRRGATRGGRPCVLKESSLRTSWSGGAGALGSRFIALPSREAACSSRCGKRTGPSPRPPGRADSLASGRCFISPPRATAAG